MKKTFVSMFMAVFLLGATSAMAAPILTWDYVLEYGFSNWEETNEGADYEVTGSENNNSGDPTKLSWGLPTSANTDGSGTVNLDDQSAIYVQEGNSSGEYILDAEKLAMTFYHQNNPLWDVNLSSTLTTATLYSTFSLVPEDEDADPETRNFLIEFWETPNASWNNDFFWLKNPEDLTFDFKIGNYVYFLEFWIEDLVDLDDHGRAAELRDHFGVASDASFYGLQTPEDGTTSFKSYFKLTYSEVPEPTTFVLFGVGLLGCSALVRRRQYR